jgi:hypothetical protein
VISSLLRQLEADMARGKSSGIALTNNDASKVLGMVGRGDRDHDIAAWFGVNQGRVAEVKDGSHGSISAAKAEDLPPKGPPGIKGRRLRASVGKALTMLAENGGAALPDALAILKDATNKYDSNEM